MVILPSGGTGNLFNSPNTLHRSKDTSDQKNLFKDILAKYGGELLASDIGFPRIKRNLEIWSLYRRKNFCLSWIFMVGWFYSKVFSRSKYLLNSKLNQLRISVPWVGFSKFSCACLNQNILHLDPEYFVVLVKILFLFDQII